MPRKSQPRWHRWYVFACWVQSVPWSVAAGSCTLPLMNQSRLSPGRCRVTQPTIAGLYVGVNALAFVGLSVAVIFARMSRKMSIIGTCTSVCVHQDRRTACLVLPWDAESVQ